MLNALYVEDDALSRQVMQMIQRLNSDAFNITIFENSENFETRLLNLAPKPDIILLDIHMTPHTGFEMLEMVRRHSQYEAIPIIALTASVMNEEVNLLKEFGFEGVIAKPLNLDEFPNLIQQVMNGETLWHIL